MLGSIIYRNRVVDASTRIKYQYDSLDKNITLLVQLPCVRVNTTALLSFMINDDSSCPCYNCSTCPAVTGSEVVLEFSLSYPYNCSKCNFSSPTVLVGGVNMIWDGSTKTASFALDGVILFSQCGTSNSCNNCISCSFPVYSDSITVENTSSSDIEIKFTNSYTLECRQNPVSGCRKYLVNGTNKISIPANSSGTLNFNLGPSNQTGTFTIN